VSNIDPTPAYPFGFGMSYSTLEFSETMVSADSIGTDGEVVVSAVIRNTGARSAVAVPQLYLSDPVAEVTRPVRQLIGFDRVELAPGATAEVGFTVSADLFAYTGRDLRRRVDAGDVILGIAEHAGDPGGGAVVRVTGATRFVDHTRVMASSSRRAVS
jgi:beta-glucosidase